MIIEQIKKIFGKDKSNDSLEAVRFKGNDDLIVNKILEYLPAMFITNLSTLMLISADGIVVGNFIDDMDLSLSAISVFYPASLLISVFTTLLAFGISTNLSTCIGYHDYEKLNYVKNATKVLLVISFFVVAIIQIPIVLIILKLYNMEPELYNLALRYGIGIMILNPFSIISTVGVYQLQILGKAKVVMYLSIMESFLNVFFDLLFVGYFHLGITGVAMGTAIAGLVRALLTFIYLFFKSDIYKSEHNKVRIEDIKEILLIGTPEAVNAIALAFKSFVMMKVILLTFGSYGGTINGVCSFCNNVANVLTMAIVASMRPLVGFYEGAKDTFSLKNVIKIGTKLMLVAVGVIIILIQISPRIFYNIHGVDEINVTSEALMSLRVYSIYIAFAGMNAILRLYLTNKKDIKFLSLITIFSYLLLPLFAYLFYKTMPSPLVWLSSSVVAFITMSLYIVRYKHYEEIGILSGLDIENDKIRKLSRNELKEYEDLGESINKRTLHLSVKPEEAMDASKFVINFAIDKGLSKIVANKMGLCIEEMIAYSTKSKKNKCVSNQINVRLYEDSGMIMMLDNGKEIPLNDDSQDNVMDNYSFLKKIVKSYQYQYVLDMNHAVFNF